eukprot:520081-Lingulodinium_polyedra.AAC.1
MVFSREAIDKQVEKMVKLTASEFQQFDSAPLRQTKASELAAEACRVCQSTRWPRPIRFDP